MERPRHTRDLVEIADAVRAIATTGMHYTEGEYDRERYERLMELAARLGSIAEGTPHEELEQVYRAADYGYVTPKIDVRAAIFRGPRILLVRERADDKWALPGGFMDIGDTPADAARRETAEEAGLDVTITRLVGAFDRRLRPEAPPHPFHIVALLFLGEPRTASDEPRPGLETTDARFWSLDELPELSLGRTPPRFVELAWRALRDPATDTLFD